MTTGHRAGDDLPATDNAQMTSDAKVVAFATGSVEDCGCFWSRHRQVGAYCVDHSVRHVHDDGHKRHRDGEHREPVKLEDLGRAR
jgi:hypothetical protein